MFSSVQLVRDLCKENGISVAKLEKICGFANGYLNPKKMAKLPYDRAKIIAEHFGVAIEYILTGENKKSTPTVFGESAIYCDIKLTKAERDLIQKFRRLDQRGQSAVLNTLEHEYAALPGEKARTAPKEA